MNHINVLKSKHPDKITLRFSLAVLRALAVGISVEV